jgi:hypothetical protein
MGLVLGNPRVSLCQQDQGTSDKDLGTTLSWQSQRCRATGGLQSATHRNRRFALPAAGCAASTENHLHPHPNPGRAPDLCAKVRRHYVRDSHRRATGQPVGALSAGYEPIAHPDCSMAGSLWLCGNRQSIIPNRGATGSRSFSNIAEQRKRPAEQMRKAVAELPAEEGASSTGDKPRQHHRQVKTCNRLISIRGCQKHFSPAAGGAGLVRAIQPLTVEEARVVSCSWVIPWFVRPCADSAFRKTHPSRSF